MKVIDGEIEYSIENKLAEKLDIMIDRITRKNQKQNAYLQNHGPTGEGKTNSSLVEAHYVKWKTSRPINLFFRLQGMIDFAKLTEEKIIIWDEPSLDSLSTDQLTKLNKDLVRLVNTARKKRHFVIVNFTKFWKFPEDLVVDTCLGMVHHDSKNGEDPGRFLYIRQKNLEYLWNAYKKSKKRLFAKCMSFGGRMPHIIEKYFDQLDITIEGHPHATLEDYERLKDQAIAGIGEDKIVTKDKSEARELKRRIGLLTFPIKSQSELSIKLGFNRTMVQSWSQEAKIAQNSGLIQVENDVGGTIINSMAESGKKIDDAVQEEGQLKKYNPIEVKAG